MNNKAILELKSVTKNIKGKKIIDNVSFSVHAGEIFGFLGPNGAGKTTTIRMITGLIGISKGDIMINDYSIKNDFTNAVKNIGGIIENPDLYKYLSGYQNLKHYARMMSGITENRIEEVVKTVGLADSINNEVRTYSLGMRQRLGLAQALLHKPTLLILDEPTNGLDPEGIHELREYLKRISHEEGVAILISSHLLSEMELMCDRIGVLKKGKLVTIQDVHSIINNGESIQVNVNIEPRQTSRAIELLINNGFDIITSDNEGKILLKANKEEIPFINQQLAKNDILVYNIGLVEQTLEEQFLRITEE
ncbi:ABC transporter ATP-binding protein [Clostridium beijerinckii]|uniref:Putative ABC transporter ATP-binding protein YxlF n=1 Tax=Clostridium beijerinckii TaxID=1520 RepID=A0A1S8S987_CLOBE|nr:ABC transporter ATP-binding protein [Clostridium beijerinckii]NRY60620.1 ABC-2 type transport system ATP-binding protein [Clostridium beijerinckii]OOM61983.1 putative ABC transporter ATP-binding protein YxlF [Clostridium beijerinckii]